MANFNSLQILYLIDTLVWVYEVCNMHIESLLLIMKNSYKTVSIRYSFICELTHSGNY
jgi:hypothetical protein